MSSILYDAVNDGVLFVQFHVYSGRCVVFLSCGFLLLFVCWLQGTHGLRWNHDHATLAFISTTSSCMRQRRTIAVSCPRPHPQLQPQHQQQQPHLPLPARCLMKAVLWTGRLPAQGMKTLHTQHRRGWKKVLLRAWKKVLLRIGIQGDEQFRLKFTNCAHSKPPFLSFWHRIESFWNKKKVKNAVLSKQRWVHVKKLLWRKLRFL